MRRWHWISSVAALVTCIAAMIGAPRLAGHVAKRKAAARGVELRADGVSLGWSRVWLKDAELRFHGVPDLTVSLDAVAVDLGWDLSVARVEAFGGRVRVAGDLAEIADSVERWAEARKSADVSSSGGGAGREIAITGVTVVVESGDWNAHVWGVSAWRRASGQGFAFDLIQADTPSSHARVVDGRFEVEASHAGGEPRVREAKVERVDARWVHASPPTATKDDEPTDEPRAGPVAARAPPAAAKGKAQTKKGETGSPLLSLTPGLGVGLHAARKKQLDRFAARLGPTLGKDASVAMKQVTLQIESSGEALHLGPAAISVRREDASLHFVYRPLGGGSGADLAIDAQLGIEPAPATFRVSGGPVPLSTLGIQEGNLGILYPDRALLSARTQATWSKDGGELRFDASGSLEHLTVMHKAIAAEPVVGLQIAWKAKGDVRLDGSYVRLEDATLRLGETTAKLDVKLERDAEHARGEIKAGIPLASCQAMLASTPRALVPLIKEMELGGSFSFDSSLELDTRRPADFELSWNVVNECEILTVPSRTNPDIFHRPFRYQVEDVDGKLTYRETGPGTPNWTPYPEISRHVETAVLVCEDSRFWVHSGFDQKAINDALHDNVRAGRFVRGASTISMQLAKNLYLGREKTLSRKFQEAVLTMLLEQQLRKDEILELYLNVIEYGPGVFGIAEAAKYYFESTPEELSIGQSLYLGSILPNPLQSHFREDGTMSEGWAKYLRHLMGIAHKIGRLSDTELEEGLLEEVELGKRYVPPEPKLVLPGEATNPEEGGVRASPESLPP